MRNQTVEMRPKGCLFLSTHRRCRGSKIYLFVVREQGPQLVVKVADFGLARVQDTARTMTGGIGTSQYTAPEVLRSERCVTDFVPSPT